MPRISMRRLTPLKVSKRGLDLVVLQPAMFGAGDHGQGVAHVQFARPG